MATMREVAKLAGVSVATVHAVINNTKKISAPVRRRVEAALKELDYRPNALARSLYSGTTKTIALLVPSISNPVFSENASAVEDYANERGYTVFIGNTRALPERADRYCDRLIEMQVDGVIVALTWENVRDDFIERFQKRGIKVVGCSGVRTSPMIDCFVIDEEAAGYDLGRYLIGLGHRTCAFVGPRRSKITELRLAGLQRAFAEIGIDMDDALISWADSQAPQAQEESIIRLVAQGVPFTCLVASADLFATTALTVLKRQGFKIPQQISVATFRDYYAPITSPGLTTMAFSDYEIGGMAAERLLQILDGADDTPSTVVKRRKLIVRESTATAPHNSV